MGGDDEISESVSYPQQQQEREWMTTVVVVRLFFLFFYFFCLPVGTVLVPVSREDKRSSLNHYFILHSLRDIAREKLTSDDDG